LCEFAKLVNRSGVVRAFESSDMSWSEMKKRKKQLASAYCWLGNLAGALWKFNCDHELGHGKRMRG